MPDERNFNLGMWPKNSPVSSLTFFSGSFFILFKNWDITDIEHYVSFMGTT